MQVINNFIPYYSYTTFQVFETIRMKSSEYYNTVVGTDNFIKKEYIAISFKFLISKFFQSLYFSLKDEHFNLFSFLLCLRKYEDACENEEEMLKLKELFNKLFKLKTYSHKSLFGRNSNLCNRNSLISNSTNRDSLNNSNKKNNPMQNNNLLNRKKPKNNNNLDINTNNNDLNKSILSNRSYISNNSEKTSLLDINVSSSEDIEHEIDDIRIDNNNIIGE